MIQRRAQKAIAAVIFAVAFIGICNKSVAALSEALPPENPNQVIEFVTGPARLAIPVRYLGPYYWHNPPVEVVDEDGALSDLVLGWPGLSDATSTSVRHCMDWHIDCRDVIGVTKRWRGEKPYHGFSVLTCCATDGTSLFRRLPSVAGAQLFLQKYGPAFNVYVKGKGKNGEAVYGECEWGEKPASFSLLHSPQRIEARIAGAGRCMLGEFSVAGGLMAIVGFDGSHFGDWKEIHAAVVDLIGKFESSNSQHRAINSDIGIK